MAPRATCSGTVGDGLGATEKLLCGVGSARFAGYCRENFEKNGTCIRYQESTVRAVLRGVVARFYLTNTKLALGDALSLTH